MIYGYTRVSTATQSMERQIRNIKALYPTAVIVSEAYTGTTLDRPKWQRLYKYLTSGDTVVFDSVSRMSRNADEGVGLYFDLMARDIDLVFLQEPYINSNVYRQAVAKRLQTIGTKEDILIHAINDYLKEVAKEQIKIAFQQSEKEVSDIRQRTKEGIETARLNGKQIGQKLGSVLNVKKKPPVLEAIERYSRDFSGTLTDPEVLKLVNVSRNTYYKYKKELKLRNMY